MTDLRWWVVGGAILLVVVVGVVVVNRATRSIRKSEPVFRAVPLNLVEPVAPSTPDRLAILLGQRTDYAVQVGVPVAVPERWARATMYTPESITVDGHDLHVTEVRAFVVAYPNGQLVDHELAGLSPPPGVGGLIPGKVIEADVVRDADLQAGRALVRVAYGPSRLRPNDRDHYSTTLTNLMDKRVRVVKFAGYAKAASGWVLNTVTGRHYSAEEFRQWYGVVKDGWIGPGESVSDPNNYGGPPLLWAYLCEPDVGERFLVGGVVE